MLRVESKWISFEDYSNLMSSKVMLDASVYHSTDWLSATASAFGCELKFVATCLDSETVSVTPFCIGKRGHLDFWDRRCEVPIRNFLALYSR